jgi:hypothetical protein
MTDLLTKTQLTGDYTVDTVQWHRWIDRDLLGPARAQHAGRAH